MEPADSLDRLDRLDRLEPLVPLEELDGLDALEADGIQVPGEDGQSFLELRPSRRLRIWQIAPIIALAVGGSLMFAFPLAFESGDAGPVVAMLGLLLCCCAAGWGLMAARRIGQTWPGLPARGSGARPDWRYVARLHRRDPALGGPRRLARGAAALSPATLVPYVLRGRPRPPDQRLTGAARRPVGPTAYDRTRD